MEAYWFAALQIVILWISLKVVSDDLVGMPINFSVHVVAVPSVKIFLSETRDIKIVFHL